MAEVRLNGIVKRYGAVEILHGVDLTIRDDRFTVLLGPSGCGKSTLLRMIAGLEDISDGTIEIGGVEVNEVDASERGCAMVFQNYALYPHKTVANNIAFPLRMAGVPKSEIETKVREVAGILELEPLLQRLPRDLSGGQRQRVAMGRAMIRQPKVYLFDEPLSNLDAELRVKMRLEISRLRDRLSATMVFVTHDQVEAMTLADDIVVMRDGRVEQLGTPLEIYKAPVNRFVAGFLGTPAMSFLKVESAVSAGAGTLLTLAGGKTLQVPDKLSKKPDVVGVRPEHVQLGHDGMWPQMGATGDFEFIGAEHLGDRSYVYLATPFGELTVLQSKSGEAIEDSLPIRVDASKVHYFDEYGRTMPKA